MEIKYCSFGCKAHQSDHFIPTFRPDLLPLIAVFTTKWSWAIAVFQRTLEIRVYRFLQHYGKHTETANLDGLLLNAKLLLKDISKKASSILLFCYFRTRAFKCSCKNQEKSNVLPSQVARVRHAWLPVIFESTKTVHKHFFK